MPRALLLPVVGLLLAACGGQAPSVATAPADLAAGTGLEPRGRVVTGVPVDRVVDGDTLHVLLDGRDVTVRMIGIDTPETVKPDSPVECFGPEASAFAQQVLSGRTVTLEWDASQGATDRFGRELAHVWREEPDGTRTLFAMAAVAGGYAEERQYGPEPSAWAAELRAAESTAQQEGRGMWGACPGIRQS